MLSDYVENYFIPVMKLDKDAEPVKKFIVTIKILELRPQDVATRLVDTYNELVNYIKKEAKDYMLINSHFNRMKFHIQNQFSVSLEYVYFK